MKDIIEKLSSAKGEASVTILVRTHRSHPDNQQDPLALKNLIKEASTRLKNEFDEETAQHRISELNSLSERIDHQHNKEGLVLVVNENHSEYYQLPIALKNRVVIDNTFATRDIVRASLEQTAYYILVLSRRQARLILANNDRVEAEAKDAFPIINDVVPDDKHKTTMAQGSDHLIEGFFNKVDKALQHEVNNSPAPVIIATEERNHDYYKKVSDKPVVVGHLNQNRDDHQAHDIVRDAWPIMKKYVQEKNGQRVSELEEAVSKQRYLSDLSDIWRAVNEGRGRTLFVQRGFVQPAKIENESILTVDSPEGSDVIDDIVDEMIEVNLNHGGDTVFLNDNDLKDFQGLALTTRY